MGNKKIRCFSLFHVAITFLLLVITLNVNAEVEIPRVHYSVKPLNLSMPPTTEELMSAGQLGGQLFPSHALENKERAEKINLSFGEAIQLWNKHEYKGAVELFWKHMEKYSDSPWSSEASLHVGCDALYKGRYKEAEESFNKIINENKNKRGTGVKKLVNKARSRLGYLKVLQNNFKSAMRNFRELKKEGLDWRDRTFASSWIQAISRYRTTELNMLDCGVRALAYVLKKEGKESEAEQVANIIPSSRRGHSISNIKHIAKKYGYNFTGLRVAVSDLEKVPLPAIVQISGMDRGDKGHYWVLDEINKDLLTFFDPQSRRRFKQNIREFSREWNGNILVISDKKDLPGTRLTKHEMTQTYGGCCGVQRLPNQLGNSARSAGPSSAENQSECGSPTWSVNMVNLSLFVTDTPLWYSSPIGPSVNITLSYNSQASITEYEPFGNKWQFNYGTYLVVDTGGEVTVFMPDGRNDIYTPDGNGGYTQPYQVFNTLTKIAENHFELKFPDDTVYVYNIPSGTTSLQPFLVEIRDAYGQQLTFGYNTDVQLTTITDAMGRETTIIYNAGGHVTQITDPLGRSATFEYDTNNNLTRITDMGGYWSGLSYDSDVYLTGIENERGIWTFYIEPADGIGNGSDPYPAPGGTMWENYRITITNPLGGKEEYHYNGYSRYAWYVSPRDYVEYTSSSNNNFRSAQKTQYTYTTTSSGQRGEILRMTYPGGGYINYGYDSSGNRTSITDSHGHTNRYSYNSMGQATSITDAKGTVTNMTYDSNGVDLLQIQNGLGIVIMTYNNTHALTSTTDRLGDTTSFTYNSYGQTTSETNAMGVVTNYAYNTNHQLQQVTGDGEILESFTYDNIGRVRTHTDAAGLTLTYDYNDLNNITRITYPDSKFVSYSYSSCCPNLKDSETDRSGRAVSYTYDALKRLTEVTNPEGGIIQYAYDANGNMTQLTDTNGNITSFEYDVDNRLVKKIFADDDCNYMTFTYDSTGLLTRRTNARGINTNYTYDANHNLLTISYSDGAPAVTYQYDSYNRVTLRQDGIGIYTYSYNANSNLVSFDGPWTNDTLAYQYDALGRRSGITPQDGESLSYTYDTLNRLTNIQTGTGAYTYAYTDANPLIQSLSRPNNSLTTYQYDSLNRLTGVSNKDSTSAIINQYIHAYNNHDLRSSETITNGNPITTFQNESVTYNYNGVNQLTSTASPSMAFAYDEDGNMTKGYTPEGYVFTATYDAENRLNSLEYTDGSGIVRKTTYHYSGDSFLAKVGKYENGSLVSDTRFVRDGFLPLQERNASNSVVNEYTWGINMGGGIGGLLNLKQGGLDYAYLYDGKGNVTTLLDSSQAVIATYTYDTFGNLMSKTGSINQPFQFSTKPYDEETGLSYYGYRFYSPAVGRWMTRDPLGEAGGINLYGFVGNNTINHLDPYGLFNSKLFWTGLAEFAAGGLTLAVSSKVTVLTGGVAAFFLGTKIASGIYGVIVGATNMAQAFLDDPYVEALPGSAAAIIGGFVAGNTGNENWNKAAASVDLVMGLHTTITGAATLNIPSSASGLIDVGSNICNLVPEEKFGRNNSVERAENYLKRD